MMSSLKSILLFALAAGTVKAHGGAQKPIISSDDSCKHPAYKSHIVSKSPLVIYLEDFITADEQAHLQEITSVPLHHLSILSRYTGFNNLVTVKIPSHIQASPTHPARKGYDKHGRRNQPTYPATPWSGASRSEPSYSRASTCHGLTWSHCSW